MSSKSVKTIGLAVGLVLLLGVGGALYYLVRNLDSLVADAIERYGSEATGTAVTVESVSIELREGKGRVGGLKVANPPGFDEPYAITWNEVSIDIDAGSIRSAPPYVVDAVRIDAPEVVFAVDGQGRVNLRVLQQRIASGGASEKASGSEGSADETRLRIRSFSFERGKAEVRTAEVGGKDLRIDLPSLQLKDLGGSSGATPGEIARRVLEAYTQQVVARIAREEVGRRLGDVLDGPLGGDEGGLGVGEDAAGRLLDRLRGD